MPRHRVGLAAAGILSNTWSDDHRYRERRHTAHGVDDAGAGEIAIAVAETVVDAELRQPAAAPRPVAEQGISDGAEEKGRNRKGGKLPALGGGTGDDGGRGIQD